MFGDVIAVVGAAIADSAVGTTVAALAAGTAESLTAATVLSAVTEVGIGLSVTGMVTGNQNLTKIGGVMAMAGGVGGLVNGAIGSAADVAANSDVGALQGASTATPEAVAAPANAISSAVDAAPVQPPGIEASIQGGPVAGQIGSAPGIDPVTGQSAGITPVGSASATPNPIIGADGSVAPQSMSYTADQTAALNPDVNLPPTTPVAPHTGGLLSTISKGFDNLSQAQQLAVTQGAMGALGGLGNAYTSSKQLALQKEQLALQQLQYTNLNAQPTFTRSANNPLVAAPPAMAVNTAQPAAPAPVVGTGLLQQPNKSNT